MLARSHKCTYSVGISSEATLIHLNYALLLALLVLVVMELFLFPLPLAAEVATELIGGVCGIVMVDGW